jgi:hypothetical protein
MLRTTACVRYAIHPAFEGIIPAIPIFPSILSISPLDFLAAIQAF